MTGQGGQLWALHQFIRHQGDVFLKPTGSESVVHQTKLRAASPSLEANLQRRDQTQQERIAQEFQVVANPLGADVRAQRESGLFRQGGCPRSLTGIAANQPEQFFQEILIPFPPALADSQIVLNDSFDHRLVEMIGQL